MKRRIITAAEGDSQLIDEMDILKDDFNFIITGFEQLERMGKDKENEARAILLELSGNIASVRSQVAEALI